AGTMQPPPTACLCRGGISWQGILLAVSLLTFWNPHPTAQLTIEPVPFDAAEGTDVLLLVHNASRNLIGYNWFKRKTADNSHKIVSYMVSRQVTILGPISRGFYTLQTVTANATVELATGEFRVHGEGFLTHCPWPQPSSSSSGPLTHIMMALRTDDPGISIRWIFNSQTLQLTDRMQLSPDHRTLSIDPVRPEDAGEYQCESRAPLSSPLTLGLSSCGEKLPKPNITINNSQPMEGEDSLALTCEPEISYATYLWKINSQTITDGDRLKLSNNNRTLTLFSVTRNDTGPYECETQNPVSASRRDPLTLNISYGPDAPIINPPDSHIRPGTNLNLSCHADSNPPAQFSWSFNGRPLESTQELSIPNLSTNNSGSYVCVAHNSVTNLHRTTTKNISISGKWTREHSIKCWVEP
uniref:Ig-like domain-containing protein n=1 Tax=Spermophilus dauricus TaxID=99837 RepID=A0A8C9QMS7_SPEDA